MTSRRQFLTILPYSFLLTACKPFEFSDNKVVNYKLEANKSTFNFNKKFKANLLLYNNENPGPLLKANVGDILKIDFKNNLDQPTSIHWHGIKNIIKMDGVPYLTQD
ncbi:MAG: multicopper oxidase domain-containing protein, partial [Alphaproteobacteria bacterium]|nr:multicopper oxidase domain-containing protein [Alphaproteobacteria bacterium]